jgi:hypothetical protein
MCNCLFLSKQDVAREEWSHRERCCFGRWETLSPSAFEVQRRGLQRAAELCAAAKVVGCLILLKSPIAVLVAHRLVLGERSKCSMHRTKRCRVQYIDQAAIAIAGRGGCSSSHFIQRRAFWLTHQRADCAQRRILSHIMGVRRGVGSRRKNRFLRAEGQILDR